jgi:hypothetical protein
MFKVKGKTKFMYFPMTASTAVLAGEVMALSGGKLIIATATTAPELIVGVLRHKIAATDADYATDLRLVEIEVPVEKNVEWEIGVTGTLAVTDIGTYKDLTAGNGTTTVSTLTQTGVTYDVFFVTGFITTARARVVLNCGPDARAKA